MQYILSGKGDSATYNPYLRPGKGEQQTLVFWKQFRHGLSKDPLGSPSRFVLISFQDLRCTMVPSSSKDVLWGPFCMLSALHVMSGNVDL